MLYKTTLVYESSFIVEAENEKDAIKLFDKQQKPNFFIGINPRSQQSISHIGNEKVKYHSEGIEHKVIRVYKCEKCPRIFKDRNRKLCEYCSES